jgi:CrcB protein
MVEPRQEHPHADAHPELPLDSDLDVEESSEGQPRPVHLRWRFVGLVFVGGTAGTASREFLTLLVPSADGFPTATLVINVVGAFLLGALLETIVRHGRDSGGRRVLRLVLGTGFLGGFTTYSALAIDTSMLAASGDIPFAVAYPLGTILIGAVATWAGIAIAASLHVRRANG